MGAETLLPVKSRKGRCKLGILSCRGDEHLEKGDRMDRRYCGGHLSGLVCGLWVWNPGEDRGAVHDARTAGRRRGADGPAHLRFWGSGQI